jgi:hypothetical protein
MAKQRLISDFLTAVDAVFREGIEDPIKAARIRAVMDGYRQEAEVLPAEIRTFLERAEA